MYSADTETDKFLEEEHGKQIRKSDMDVVNLKHYQSTMVHTTCPFTKEEYSNSTNIRAWSDEEKQELKKGEQCKAHSWYSIL